MNNKLLRQGNLIHKPGDDELAEIRYVQIKKNSTGMEEIEAQGRFLSGWLDKRILLAEINTTATAQVLIKRVVTEKPDLTYCCRKKDTPVKPRRYRNPHRNNGCAVSG